MCRLVISAWTTTFVVHAVSIKWLRLESFVRGLEKSKYVGGISELHLFILCLEVEIEWSGIEGTLDQETILATRNRRV